jgi:superfamily II DNA/RNA helicase
LAAQVGDTFVQLGRHLSPRIKVAAVFGGVSINPQMIDLRWGADLVVATPGRLLDLVDNNALSLAHVNTLVLDEADRLLDLGFEDELNRILALLPPARQTLLFSATFPASIQALANDLLHEPEHIDAEDEALSAPDIRQRAIEVDPGQRTQLLRHLLLQEGWGRALVFVASRHAAEVVAAKLCKAGIQAEALHGDLSQGRRTRVLQEFKQEQVQVLVATDVASRGIDIMELPVVVNYDLPRSTTDYTHRIGRTGRAGQSGVAISFISAGTAAHFRLIEKRGRLRVPRERIAGFEPMEALAPNPADPAATGGIKGTRPSRKDKLRAAAALEKRDKD